MYHIGQKVYYMGKHSFFFKYNNVYTVTNYVIKNKVVRYHLDDVEYVLVHSKYIKTLEEIRSDKINKILCSI